MIIFFCSINAFINMEILFLLESFIIYLLQMIVTEDFPS